MGAYGSVSTGYDPGYLLRESSKGAEGYYLSAVTEIGEPPGVWTGRACPALGLVPGAEVEPRVMELLYGKLADPRDPGFADPGVPDSAKVILGQRPRKYKTAAEHLAKMLAAEPEAGPERIAELEVKAAKKARSAVMFLDFTFSVDKSTSVLHASLQAAAVGAERDGRADDAAEYRRQAAVVEDAVRAGAAAAVDWLQDEAGYSRSGYHSGPPKDERGRPLAAHGTGRWTEAHEWVVASFLQHTSRDHDMQLHVHNAVLNRVPNDDGEWRTIDSRALHRERAAASAIGGRVADEIISRELGAAYEQRADGKARELTGVPQQVKDLFSSRRAVITRDVAALAAAYEDRHGRPPSARALFSMAQFATLNSRRAKPRRQHAPTREEMLDGWTAQATAAELGGLADIPARVTGSLAPGAPGITALGAADIDAVLSAAVADVQGRHAAWTRSQLLAAVDAHLPGWLGGLDAATVRRVLADLTDQALSGTHGVVSLEAAELVPVPAELTRADGRSVYRPHDSAMYSTRPHLDAEEQLLAAAGQTAGPAADPARTAAALGATPEAFAGLPGRVPPAAAPVIVEDEVGPEAEREFAGGLRPDQAAAVYGILTGARPVDILIGPAGSGKSRAMGALADLWHEQTGGNVVGVATAENAAQVLGAEGIGTAYNIAKFLALAARRPVLRRGDLLIVDEAGMVSTPDLTALHAIARAAGAKLLLTGDPMQLPAVGAGGALAMLAREHGHWQLTQVQRMEQQWEREASLRLRDGDAAVLADYDRHGRLTEGTADQAAEAAYRGWLADRLSGRDSLLIAATNTQAAELSARAQSELAALGLVDADPLIALADGNSAGPGDIVQARRNDKTITDPAGRRTANRDIWQVIAYASDPDGGPGAVVRRDLGPGPGGARRWSDPFTVPAAYLASSATLGYASTAHAAQGRTADTAHAVITEQLSRALAYVALTRGRTANYAYAVTGPAVPDVDRQLGDPVRARQAAADLRPGTRAAPALETPGQAEAPEARDRARAREESDAAGAPWAPESTAIGVLAAALEREPGEPTALDALRDDAERVRHLAHLGAIRADLAGQEAGRRYDAHLARLLTPAQYERLQDDEARETLYRQVRHAELAGWPAGTLLARAVRMRPLEGHPGRRDAAGIAKVLHSRITTEIPGALRPPRPSTWAQRTPAAASPEVSAYLARIAAAMDARTAQLGRRAAANPPAWATAHLGPVPADPRGRAGWARRAGAAAAWREQHGWTDPARAIGREPAAPEERAAWHTAAAALGITAGSTAAATDGELHAARAAYERKLAWAPAWVGPQLRTAALAAREARVQAVIARHQAALSPADPARAARAAELEQRAAALERRQALLQRADAYRARNSRSYGQVQSSSVTPIGFGT
jgi:hypothetical protein